MKKCCTCEIELTAENSSPSSRRTGGRCKSCKSEYNKNWYETEKGRAYRAYQSQTRDVTKEPWYLDKGFRPLSERTALATEKRKLRFERLEKKRQKERKEELRKLAQPFQYKIFQLRVCKDCGKGFETLYPAGFCLGLYNSKVFGALRCRPCRSSHRRMRHGDFGVRCRFFGVPFDDFNISRIFERDNWTCQSCGILTPKEKRGNRIYSEENSDTPELDHIWPLSKVVDGQQGPGHVFSNCQCLCRKCNASKNSDGATPNEWRKLKGILFPIQEVQKEVWKIVCAYCKVPAEMKRKNAKYCSGRCQRKSRQARRKL